MVGVPEVEDHSPRKARYGSFPPGDHHRDQSDSPGRKETQTRSKIQE